MQVFVVFHVINVKVPVGCLSRKITVVSNGSQSSTVAQLLNIIS